MRESSLVCVSKNLNPLPYPIFGKIFARSFTIASATPDSAIPPCAKYFSSFFHTQEIALLSSTDSIYVPLSPMYKIFSSSPFSSGRKISSYPWNPGTEGIGIFSVFPRTIMCFCFSSPGVSKISYPLTSFSSVGIG